VVEVLLSRQLEDEMERSATPFHHRQPGHAPPLPTERPLHSLQSWHPSSTQTPRKGGEHEKTYLQSNRLSIRVPNRPPMVFAGDAVDLLLSRRKLKPCFGYTAALFNLAIPKLVSHTAALPLSDGDRRHGT
jgi:hypothetical protein